MKRRITQEERQELINAVQAGEVDRNVTAFADAYASDHGLNANTVRSAITRVRRELAGDRPARVLEPGPGRAQAARDEWCSITLSGEPEFVGPIGAASLIRYANDEPFRQAVDLCRPKIEELYATYEEFKNQTLALKEATTPAGYGPLLRQLKTF